MGYFQQQYFLRQFFQEDYFDQDPFVIDTGVAVFALAASADEVLIDQQTVSFELTPTEAEETVDEGTAVVNIEVSGTEAIALFPFGPGLSGGSRVTVWKPQEYPRLKPNPIEVGIVPLSLSAVGTEYIVAQGEAKAELSVVGFGCIIDAGQQSVAVEIEHSAQLSDSGEALFALVENGASCITDFGAAAVRIFTAGDEYSIRPLVPVDVRRTNIWVDVRHRWENEEEELLLLDAL